MEDEKEISDAGIHKYFRTSPLPHPTTKYELKERENLQLSLHALLPRKPSYKAYATYISYTKGLECVSQTWKKNYTI